MKNFRFLISLILSSALLLGLLPHGAFAATVITDISIVNFGKPTEGMTASEATVASVPAGAHYHIEEYSWYCDNDEDDMTADDIFKRNKRYSFGVTVVADSGYTFTQSTAASINGGTDLIDYDYTGFDSDENCYYIWTLPDYPTPTKCRYRISRCGRFPIRT